MELARAYISLYLWGFALITLIISAGFFYEYVHTKKQRLIVTKEAHKVLTEEKLKNLLSQEAMSTQQKVELLDKMHETFLEEFKQLPTVEKVMMIAAAQHAPALVNELIAHAKEEMKK